MKSLAPRTLSLLTTCLALAGTASAQQKEEPAKRPPAGEFRKDQRPAQDGQRPPADGQRPPADGQRQPQEGFRGRDPFASLNLTEEQRTAIREAFQATAEQSRELGEKMMAARKSLQDAIWAEKLDTALIRKRAEELAKVEGESAVLRAQGIAKIRPLLKADQIEQLKNSPPFGMGRPSGFGEGQPGGGRPPREGDAPAPGRPQGGERKPDAPRKP